MGLEVQGLGDRQQNMPDAVPEMIHLAKVT
jgi:hypothetical protein